MYVYIYINLFIHLKYLHSCFLVVVPIISVLFDLGGLGQALLCLAPKGHRHGSSGGFMVHGTSQWILMVNKPCNTCISSSESKYFYTIRMYVYIYTHPI